MTSMTSRQSILITAVTALTLFLTACSGGSSNTPPPPAVISVAFSAQPPSTLVTGATASISAVVSNDSKGAGVNWTATCGSSACGSFSAASTASGTATTYTAPAAVPTSNTVTITATSVSDATKTAAATITITAPPISVSLSPTPPPTLTISTSTSLTAVVTNDSKNGGVTWTATCAAAPCGSFSSTSTASGTATTYTAPSTVPTSGSVTITATSVSDTTKNATATITIVTPALSVTFNPALPSSIAIGATSSLTAIVSNDSKNGGVNWTVTCGSSACGSFSPTMTASGAATTYTAPATIPTPNTVTITATSVSDSTKSVSAAVTIAAGLADGTYIYHFSGYDATGPSYFVGAFTIAGGVITGGNQDFVDAQSKSSNPLVPSACSLTTTGSTVQVVLATANTAVGVNTNGNGVITLRGKSVSASRILISEFDTFGSGTGSIDLQTSTAAPSGGYAFLISGWDVGTQINPLVIGGVLNITGTSVSATNSIFDYNLGGTFAQALLFASGSVSAPDNFGRVTFTLNPSTASTVPSFILTGYIVSPTQIQLVESQTDVLSDDLGGMALGQGAKTGTFNQASIANSTYVYATLGEDVNNLTSIAGSFIFGPSGAVTGTLALNDISFFGVNSISGGTYTVGPTGRVTISNVTAQPLNATFSFQLYLDGAGNALQLGIDALQVTSGPAYLQTSTSADFEGTYALLGQGLLNNQNLDAWGAVGPVTVASDTFTGTTDNNAQDLTPTSAVALTGTENNSTAQLSLTGLDALAFTSARTYSYFPIDSNRVLAIEIDGNQIGTLTLETAH